MIQEDYVTFEQAKLLKEKGFPQDSIMSYLYNEDGTLTGGKPVFIDGMIACPFLSTVRKWMVDEKNIEPLEYIKLVPNEPYYNIGDKKYVYKVDNKLYVRYEKALSAVIDKILETL